ncbi:MAG: OmpA family protein [Spirochaetes bacterium]|nr:OmpA family protein [Spirochaetota bacterium]
MMVLLMEYVGYSLSNEEVESLIRKAETISVEIDKNLSTKKYLPADVYSDALLHIIYARNQLDEKLYNSAYFYATLSIIKFEVASVLAEAGRYEYDLLVRQRDACGGASGQGLRGDIVNTMFESGFEKTGSVYRARFLDKYLFVKNRTRLNGFGRERLDRIALIMNHFPKCSAKIVGHSVEYDTKGYTERKASVVAKYLISKGIQQERIVTIGLGNREVMETNLGYRRADRIEIVLSDITL